MRKRLWMVLALVAIVPAMLFLVACPAKQTVQDDSSTTAPPPADTTTDTPVVDTSEQDRLEAERLKAQELERARMAAMEEFTSVDIYFEFDSAALVPASQDILSKKADYILANSGVSIEIEGHCDERGTDAYNVALGERRAEAAKAFLVNLGVSESQISTISYGEDKPVDPGKNEEAWSKNRRAHFAIK